MLYSNTPIVTSMEIGSSHVVQTIIGLHILQLTLYIIFVRIPKEQGLCQQTRIESVLEANVLMNMFAYSVLQ